MTGDVIVKVQRPIEPPDADWLVYAQGRKHMKAMAFSDVPAYVRAQMGDDYRAYFFATFNHLGRWTILDRTEEQS